MPSWAGSLQFRLTAGFALILAAALLSVSAYASAVTQREVAAFADEVTGARAERLDRLVSDSYENAGGWEGVQLALEQVSALYDWRVVIEDEFGDIVGDSHFLFNRMPMRGQRFQQRPVMIAGRRLGTFLIEPDQGHLTLGADSQRIQSRLRAPTAPGPAAAPAPELQRIAGPVGADVTDAAVDTVDKIAAEPPLSRLAASFNQSLLLAGLAAGAAGIALMVLTTRQALRPVRQLSAAAGGLATGDLSQRVAVTGGGEVGRLGAAFNEMASSLESAEQERRRLVADIAHELRSPLTNIQGYLEAIKDGVLEPDEETIETLYSQTRHLAALVEDLRLLALVEAGSLRLDVSPVDLARLVADAADAFRPRADERGVRLDVVPVDGLPPTRVDATRIRQVVSNLVENALLHTPEGGTVTVSVGGGPPGVARVTVRDTGAGIPAEELAHVFDRFYRVDRSRDRATGGAGLGLTIVKRLVEVHGGTVAAASRPDEGTTFTVELPFAGPASDA